MNEMQRATRGQDERIRRDETIRQDETIRRDDETIGQWSRVLKEVQQEFLIKLVRSGLGDVSSTVKSLREIPFFISDV